MSTLSPAPQFTFNLSTGRILLALSPLMVLLARLIAPYTDQLTLVNDIITVSIIVYGLAFFILSYTNSYIRQHLYYFTLAGLCMHGVDSFVNLHLLGFSNEGQTDLLIYTFISVWFLVSRNHLILYQSALVSVLILVYFLTPNQAPGASAFVMQYAVIHILLFLLIGSRIRTLEQVLDEGLAYKHLFTKLQEGVFRLDTQGYLRTLNPQLAQLSGYSEAELLNDFHVKRLIPEQDHELLELRLDARKSGRSDRYEMRLLRKDGSLVWVQVSAAPLFDAKGQIEGSVSIFSDISLRKRAEQERDTLLRDIALLQEQVQRKTEELEHCAARTSEDLRLPLQEMAVLLQAPAPDLAQLQRKVGQMMQHAQTLGDFARTGNSRFRMQPLSLAGIAALLKDEGALRPDPYLLDIEELPCVEGDAAQMERFLRNLIESALRYRGASTPHFRLSASEQLSKGEYLFALEDNGAGIPPSDFEELYHIFQRHKNNGEAGLQQGLGLCRRIIEQHGGRLWFTSETGKGTIFYFSLPIPGFQPEETGETSPARQAQH